MKNTKIKSKSQTKTKTKKDSSKIKSSSGMLKNKEKAKDKIKTKEKVFVNLSKKIKEVKAEETEVRVKRKYTKHKLSKEDIEKAIKIRDEIIKSNRKVFAKISKDALNEFDDFNPCMKCKFISRTCISSCAIAMKWRDRVEQSKNENNFIPSYRRSITENEFYDTSSMRLGLAEEVDAMIDVENNGGSGEIQYIEDINNNENNNDDITSYEVSDDENIDI